MKKGLKITLIVIGVLVGIIALDTLQAKIFDNSPLLKIRDNLDGGTLDYIDKGMFVNHYHCKNNEDVTTWKGVKFACSIKEDSNSNVPSKKELEEINNKIIDYFMSSNKDYDNYSFNYVDITNNVVVVGLLNNSNEMQEEFRTKVVDSPYINFIQGNPMQNYN